MTLQAFSSVTAIVLFAVLLAWLVATRPYLIVALLWLLIPMVWRLISCLYIDAAGPVFAEQLETHIGPGNAAPLLAFDYAIVLAVFAAVLPRHFSPSAAATGRWQPISDVAFGIGVALLAALYLDLLRIGSIPLFSGIERYDYARDYGGELHRLFFRFGDVIALCLGCLYVLPACLGGRAANRFAYLLLVMLAYALLTGHRYSSFFKFCTLFALPCALLFPLRKEPGLSERARYAWFVGFALVAVALMVSYAVFTSYFSVRYDDTYDALSNLEQRVLVQQGELWWLTYERVVGSGRWSFGDAAGFLFVNPINAASNTSIQYLMYSAVGREAFRLLDAGQHYSGGFPEMPHELFGPAGGVIAVALLSLPPALLLRLLLGSLAQGRILTAAWSGVVLYPFAIMYWGGMLNFVLAWSFWLKLAMLALALVLAYRATWKPLTRSPYRPT